MRLLHYFDLMLPRLVPVETAAVRESPETRSLFRIT
jgi:hypothetical protein